MPLILEQPPELFTSENIKFLATFKAYVRTLIHIQAVETKKRIICLNSHESEGKVEPSIMELSLRPDGYEELIDEYKNSEECQDFLSREVPEILMANAKMRLNLAIHQGYLREELMQRRPKLIGASLTGTPRREFVGYEGATCAGLSNKLFVGTVDFCVQDLGSLMRVKPRHLVEKFSIGFLDNFFEEEDLPEVVSIDPLTWDEVKLAMVMLKDKFTNNSVNTQAITDWAELEEEEKFDLGTTFEGLDFEDPDLTQLYKQIRAYESDVVFNKLFEVLKFQSPGPRVFSGFEDGSAPKVYTEIITRYPVLAFYRPDFESTEIDCENDENIRFNMVEVCYQYIAKLSQAGFDSPIRYSNSASSNVFPALARGYKKIYELNRALLRSLDMKYDSSEFLEPTTLEIKEEPNLSDIDGWIDLVTMDVALENFLEMSDEFDHKNSDGFVAKARNEEVLKTLGVAAGAIGLAFSCALTGGLLLFGCVLVGGLGANLYFYNYSLDMHNEMLLKHFSLSTSTSFNGDKLTLIEFEKLRSAVQDLYLETLLLGFGTGVGDVGGKMFNMVKNSKLINTKVRVGN